MASSSKESQDKSTLLKFTRLLALKVAQIVVQSRQGKKITHKDNLINRKEESTSLTQWFSLSIPDDPKVNQDVKEVLNCEIVEALTNMLCVEISLKTNDGEEMVLELWTVKMTPEIDIGLISTSTIYYRMSIMLKSTLSISRITPAYKMARNQAKEYAKYKILHKIYGGEPNKDLLGDNYKTIKISDLKTPIGMIAIEVLYRTNLSLIPNEKPKNITSDKEANIIVKNDHFPIENSNTELLEQYSKKEIDLSKPLTAGAFVDVEEIKELHNTLSQQLPPAPSTAWLLDDQVEVQNGIAKITVSKNVDILKVKSGDGVTSSSAPSTLTKAIEVPKSQNNDKYNRPMEFPFADGSPLTELATFYKECLHARSVSDEWTEVGIDASGSTDSETLSRQLKMYEEAVPEFDNMVASMLSNSENGSDSS